MEIKHLKFEELDSTQLWLKENIISHLDSHALVSTKIQSKGSGRLGNSWDQFGASLAFSFLIKPCQPLTLTSLEIGLQVANFLSSKHQVVFLKWPNDLLIKDKDGFKKVGGILSNYHNENTLIVGIGLNLELKNELASTANYKFPPGQINLELKDSKEFHHSIPYDFYKYLINNRLEGSQIIPAWNNLCAHKDSKVEIIETGKSVSGFFVGLGPNGEALIKGPNGIEKYISGSLIF